MTTSTLAPRATSVAADITQKTPQAALETFVREGWHEEVQRRLAARYGRVCGTGLVEEAIGHALEKATSRLEACHGRQVYLFVLTTAERWLLDNSKGARRAQARGWAKRVDLTALDQVPDDRNPGIADALAARDGDAMREEIASALLHRLEVDERIEVLPERVQLVMSLFHVEQLTKREIRDRTGLTVKQLRTALAAGNKFLHDEYLAIESRLEAGDCADAQAGVTRLVFNLAHGREARAARAHIRHCLSCALRVRQAEATRNAMALLLPPTAAVPSAYVDQAPLDQALGVGGQVRAFASRALANADLLQPASFSGAGRAVSGPLGAALTKAAAVCLAGGSIAATCIGVAALDSPETDTPTTSRRASPVAVTATSAKRPAAPGPIPAVNTARPPVARTVSRKRKTLKRSGSRVTPEEFFSSGSAPSVTTTETRQPATPRSATSSSASQPPEFPIF